MPVPVQIGFLGVAVLLGAAMLLVGAGVASKALAGFGEAMGDAVSRVGVQTAAPRASGGETDDRPVFDAPQNDGFTNQSTISLTGTIPGTVAGKTGYQVRIYTIGTGGKRLRYADVAVSATVRFGVDKVKLNAGANTFTATLVGPHGEGGESPQVTYTLDTTPPKITISSPAKSATIQTGTVDVKGKTEASASVSVRSSRGTGSSTVTADANGAFQATVPLVAGDNTLTVSATDRAGNTASVDLAVKRSLGKLSASLSAKPSKLPAHTATSIVLTVRATASDGSPLANAHVVFTVNVPGLGPIQSPELTTNALGQATWSTTIQNPTPGSGFATAIVTAADGTNVTASTAITVSK